MTIHVVKPGETIRSIAGKYGVSEERLIEDNQLTHPERLVVGQTLVILYPKLVYTVKPGDTVQKVAGSFGITLNQLYRNNSVLGGEPVIYPGQTLVISFTQEKLGGIAVNGYAYPFIDMGLLRATMPFATYLTPFTYGFSPTGELIEPDDRVLIRTAKEYGVQPLMHLSTLTKEGYFSNELPQILFADPKLQEKLIDGIVAQMQERGYQGLDIDFEFVKNTKGYVEFVSKLHDRLKPLGYPVITALAPKVSANQKGLLYEGHDFKGLGEASDAVLVMTYEWGYTYGPPMAVAPIRNVRKVLDYAVTEIPAEKILLGIPNYGYDWTLPFVKGESKARSISNYEAVEIAWENKAEIMYDETAQAPFFRYTAPDGKKHEVWFEDARSIQEKLKLIPEYGLLGAGYWNFMRPFPQNWLVLNALFDIEQEVPGM